MNEKEIYSLLGLCMKAGRLLSGSEQVEEGLKKGKGRLLLIAEDSAERTSETYRSLADNAGIPWHVFGEKEKLGWALGKGVRTAVLITDPGFSRAICRKLEGPAL